MKAQRSGDSRCTEWTPGGTKREGWKYRTLQQPGKKRRIVLQSAGPAASVLAKVLSYGVDSTLTAEVDQTLVLALTHPGDKVIDYAADGIGFYLANKHPRLVRRYARVLLAAAAQEKELRDAESDRHFVDRSGRDEINSKVREAVRSMPPSEVQFADEKLAAFDLKEWHGQHIANSLRAILAHPRVSQWRRPLSPTLRA